MNLSSRENTKDRISKVIIRDLQLNLREDEISHIKKLDDLFGMDSVAVIELIIGLEKEFNITIQPGYLDYQIFRDLDALTDFINKLVSVEKGSGSSS
jgi:acyl carrier protein